MNEHKPLSERDCYHLAWDIRDGRATPDEARLVLEYFCTQFEMQETVPPWLLTHLRDCFKSYLSGDRTIHSSLGLSRPRRGRPKNAETNPNRTREIAASVLEHRVAGLSLQDAASKVSELYNMSSDRVREVWRHNKNEALMALRVRRESDRNTWKAAELRRLKKLFPQEPWHIYARKLSE